MAIELTEKALHRVTALKASGEGGEWLRLGIRGGGCSGLSYFLDFVAAPEDKDKTFELGDGVKVCVDRKSYLFLNGVRVDFQEGVMKTGFVFENPNAASTCSCGTSFTV